MISYHCISVCHPIQLLVTMIWKYAAVRVPAVSSVSSWLTFLASHCSEHKRLCWCLIWSVHHIIVAIMLAMLYRQADRKLCAHK